MNRPELIDAFHDCLTLLQAGATLEACLQRYPDLAAGLRPLLETAQQVGRARAGTVEVRQAQARVRARVVAELQRPPTRRFWAGGVARLGVAAALVLVLAALFAGRQPLLNFLQGRTPTPPLAITLTPVEATPMATPSPTATLTLTTTLTATPTMTPTRSLPASATPQGACAPTPPEGWAIYQVQPGDSLSRLADVAGVTVEALQAVNCLDDHLIVAGETLFVPEDALAGLAGPPASSGGAGPAGNSGGGTSGGNEEPGSGGSSFDDEDDDDDNDGEDDDDLDEDD